MRLFRPRSCFQTSTGRSPSVRAQFLGLGLGLLGLTLAGLSGCGVDEIKVSPLETNLPVFDGVRQFSEGSVDVSEQLFRTEGSRLTSYRLNARLFNRGADFERAVYEMIVRAEIPTSVERTRLQTPTLLLGPEEVVQREELGVLRSNQDISVTLDHEVYGDRRVRIQGRLVQDPLLEDTRTDLP